MVAPPARRETVTFRDATLRFKNFKGEKKQYNAEGDRNFNILLGEEDALELQTKGWNVKPLKRQEEDDEQLYILKVKVNFQNKPPRCWLVSNVDPETGLGRSRNMLSESVIGILDDLESTRVDLTVVAYDWDIRGTQGRTAYLENLFFTMYESELEREYANVEQMGTLGDVAATPELESGSRMAYDYDGEVVEGEVR